MNQSIKQEEHQLSFGNVVRTIVAGLALSALPLAIGFMLVMNIDMQQLGLQRVATGFLWYTTIVALAAAPALMKQGSVKKIVLLYPTLSLVLGVLIRMSNA